MRTSRKLMLRAGSRRRSGRAARLHCDSIPSPAAWAEYLGRLFSDRPRILDSVRFASVALAFTFLSLVGFAPQSHAQTVEILDIVPTVLKVNEDQCETYMVTPQLPQGYVTLVSAAVTVRIEGDPDIVFNGGSRQTTLTWGDTNQEQAVTICARPDADRVNGMADVIFDVDMVAIDSSQSTDTLQDIIERTAMEVEPETVPDPPTGLGASCQGGQATLNWGEPFDGFSPITEYQYRLASDNGFGRWMSIPSSGAGEPNSSSYIITGLVDGEQYTLQIRAVNELGESDVSNSAETECQLPPEPPGPPTQPGATCDSGEVALTWQAPTDDGRAPITGYQYRWEANENSIDWMLIPSSGGGEANSNSYTVTGLDDGEQYTFWIRAVNSAGESTSSAMVATQCPLPPPDRPGQPTDLNATSCDDGRVTLRWRPPENDGGTPLTGYEYQTRSESMMFGPWIPIRDSGPGGSNGRSFSVADLDAGTRYAFRVRAVNQVGAGDGSAEAGSQCASGPPGAPVGLEAIPGNGRVTLRWQIPEHDGGAPISKYQYQQRAGSGAFSAWTDIPDSGPGGSHSTGYTVMGLTNGTLYTFRVRAVNSASEQSVGTESASAPVSATPTPTAAEKRAVERALEGTIRAIVGNTVSVLRNRSLPTGGASSATRPTLNLETVPISAGTAADSFGVRDPFSNGGMAGSGAGISLQDLLAAGVLEIPLSATDDGDGGIGGLSQWTVWGMGDLQDFENAPQRGPTYDGRLRAGHLGIDALGDGWLAGVSVSRMRSESDYTLGEDAGDDGRLVANMTGVQPYLHYWPDDANHLFAMVGLSRGEVETEVPDGAIRESSDIWLWMASLGARRTMTSAEALDRAVFADLTFARAKTDEDLANLAATRGLTVEAWTARLGVEGSHTTQLATGAELSSFVEFAGRADNGVGEGNELGVEISPGVYLFDPSTGLGLEVRGHWLALYSAENYRERGLSVNASITPDSEGTGLSIVLSPQWGATGSSAGTLWRHDELGSTRAGTLSEARDTMSFDSRIGYGIRARGGLMTPYGEFSVREEDGRLFRVGTRFDLVRAGSRVLSLDFSGERWEGTGDEPDHRLVATGRMRF